MSSLSAELPVSEEEAQQELELFEAFCRSVLTTEPSRRAPRGKPLELYEGERRMLWEFFRGIRETLIIIPKKNGKSTLIGAVALYHLCTTPDAECVIVASSRDQAGIMLRQIQGFIRRSRSLQNRLQVKQREIVHKTNGGRIRILASDVDTADGVIPTLAIVDELHRHKSADLYGVLRDGLGPREGQLIAISTAGDDEQSSLGVLRRNAYQFGIMTRDGCYRHVMMDSFVMHEWALDPEDDRTDIELVKSANPAPWHSIKELEMRRRSPSMKDWQWARYACGVWLGGENSAISFREWRACSIDIEAEGLENGLIPVDAIGVHIGVDLGWRWDTTAFIPVWQNPRTRKFRVGRPTIITPPRDGTATDFDKVFNAAKVYNEMWQEVTFVLDPNADGEQLAQKIEAEFHAEVVEYSQQPQPMALAAQRLSALIARRDIEHPDDEELNAHVISAAARTVGEGWRFDKQRKKRLPIDGVIALAMAVSNIIGDLEEEEEFSYASW